MRQSRLFTKTIKQTPADEVSTNAGLLIKAGFVDKLSAGVYSYLPLGLMVLENIKNIVRDEMNKMGATEILMPALIPKQLWTKTERWDEIDVLFKLKSRGDKDFALGSTHEEVVTPLVKKFVQSYRDLPVAVYQIQDKFRDEPRAKSGLLRGREFSMKDLYSFHASQQDLEDFYEKTKDAYTRVFDRCGLDSHIVEATGGVFSKFSHEFQVFTEHGEDDIYFCGSCARHQNKELVEDGNIVCPHCGESREVKKAIEVGNIFKLKTKFSNAFGFKHTAEDGKQAEVLMGCYGIGPSRVMGAIVEVHSDESGIVWPETVAPFDIHLVSLLKDDQSAADKLYNDLIQAGKKVLYDDRQNVSAGEKLSDSDLMGMPNRLVVSQKTQEDNKIELKLRASGEIELIDEDKIISQLT